jgi:hypothetical protein
MFVLGAIYPRNAAADKFNLKTSDCGFMACIKLLYDIQHNVTGFQTLTQRALETVN